MAYKQRIRDERRRKEEVKSGAARVNAELQDMFDQLMAPSPSS
jgi:hypothetical protein